MAETLLSREDCSSLLFRYLDPLLPRYSERGALVCLSGGGAQYEDEVIPFEAWTRPLWGLAPLWHGGGRSEGGAFERIYPRGLGAGTDPASPEYWGGFRDHDQRFVEMAAIAYGLLLAPEVMWEPLSVDERKRVADWLARINDYACPQGNWLWFQALVNLALRSLGQGWSEEVLSRDLDAIDGFYLGDGWYQDGPTGLPDYYNAMTFQFFSLLYAWLFHAEDPTRAARYHDRTRRFAEDYVHLFSDRGEGVPYGRSMTYRFAQAGFWSMAALTHADLGPGFSSAVLRGLVERNLLAWDPARICDNGGVFSIGYRYPNLHMAEGYNAAGSPMWALMAFACLGLPAEDPYWSCDAAPLPEQHALCETAMGVVQRDETGEVTLYPDGRVPGHPFAQSDAKYSKLAYNSRFGFSVARSGRTLEEAAPDSMLAVVIHGRVLVRDGVEWADVRWRGQEVEVVSRWSPWPGIEVETTIVPAADGRSHLRIHRVTSSMACEAYDCGFAVPGDYHRVSVDDALCVCDVRAVGETLGDIVLIRAEANTNVSCAKTVIPAVRYAIPIGTSELRTAVAWNPGLPCPGGA